jgi:hypothetical protein
MKENNNTETPEEQQEPTTPPDQNEEEDWHNELDRAWKHLGSALSEGMTGASALIEALIFFGNDTKAPSAYSSVIPMLKLVKSLLEIWQAALPEADLRARTFHQAKIEALEAIHRAMAAEKKKLSQHWPRNEDDQVRLDVYDSIIAIIDREIQRYRRVEDTGEENSFRRVVVE